MSTAPRLTIGLPVYNGEKYVAESLESLLGQSFTDFELIISDNASTDSTGDICRDYEKQDSRVRYFRQPRNIGLAPNVNFIVGQAGGELYKEASHDDLYARDLLESCVAALDEYPQVVLAHSWTAKVDGSGKVTEAYEYPLTTATSRTPERFRSMLFDSGGDDDYGVMRMDVRRRIALMGSHHHSDRTITAEIVLYGPFYQVPDWLYFRREHPGQNGHAPVRRRCANMDPRRADRLRHPAVRLYGEYVWAYVSAIKRAPLSAADRRDCYRYLAQWLTSRGRPGSAGQDEPVPVAQPDIQVDSVVAGRQARLS
ncbi:MAG: glycosyltransferase family 2 protein [Streptosporangiaceae bacterium]